METIPLNNERVSLVNAKLLTKHQRIVALILLPYNISIIQKLKGHIKGRLISRIYQSHLTPFNIGQITDQFRPVNKLSIPTGERCEPRENLRASDSRVTSRDSPQKESLLAGQDQNQKRFYTKKSRHAHCKKSCICGTAVQAFASQLVKRE